MPIEFALLKKDAIDDSPDFKLVKDIAVRLHRHLDEDTSQALIRERHVLGASSLGIQQVILEHALALGFQDEKRGLFAGSQVSSLRPDYYRPLGNTGILLEVERGKTIANNMDLLDMWKCHICPIASFLFLVVPQIRESKNGSRVRVFNNVCRRISQFFAPQNHVNVDAVFIFGY